AAVLKHEFVVCLITLKKILAITKPVATKLQMVDNDLVACVRDINLCIDVLKEKRRDVEELMVDIKEEAESLLLEPLEKPRTTGRQRNRPNMAANTPEEYFKRSILIPFLDGIVDDLMIRFQSHNTVALKMCAFIPSYLQRYSFDDVKDIINFYEKCHQVSLSDMCGEYERWCVKWKKEEGVPICPAKTLSLCDQSFFPNIYCFLKLFCCLPTTTASAERTFSTLRYLKNYLRSTTSEMRLNDLTRLYIRKDIPLNIDRVIDTFALRKRKHSFSI
ncbi:MAG: hAT transposon family protein, partial [Pseudomonadota bacterium]